MHIKIRQYKLARLMFNQDPVINGGSGGVDVTVTDTAETKDESATDSTEEEAKDGEDKFDKPGGPKALAAEREAHKQTKAELAALRKQVEESKPAGDYAALQARLEQLESDNEASKAEAARERIARTHGLNDADTALLGKLSDETVMAEVAARLAGTPIKDDSSRGKITEHPAAKDAGGSAPKASGLDLWQQRHGKKTN